MRAVCLILTVVGTALLPAAPASAAGRAFEVHNATLMQTIRPSGFKGGGPLAPVQLDAVRNGAFAAQLVVTDVADIKGLKVSASDLRGPGTIPAGAVEVRFALPDMPPSGNERLGAFDSLEAAAPEEVSLYQGAAVQPIWLTVRVPADAAPGDYTGTVTVAAEGVPAVAVPLAVKVHDWALPHANDFSPYMDYMESPESVALAYKVDFWSDEHFALLDKTFALLKPLACKTVYVTAVRRTHLGNEHAMVRWVRDEAGDLQPDFSVVEKYLDVVTRHLGAVPGVILYCWEPMESMGHAGGAGRAERTHDKPILITALDSETGNLLERKGPAWGTPEAKAFWKKLTDGLMPVLKKRGLEGSLLFGLIGDARPTKQAMDDITTGVPNAKWAMHSHYYAEDWQGYDLGMCVALWGIHLNIVDPGQGYGYGWLNPVWLAYYPREMALNSSLLSHRFKLEMWLGAYSTYEMKRFGKSRTARGLGRIGADFWTVLPDARGRVKYSLAGRYPESYWGQLNLNYCIPYILGKGPSGPLPTVRSEAFREGIQEAEARVFIEKAIVPEENRAKVGEDLAKRCRAMLDDRIRMVNRSGGARNDQRSGGGDFKAEPDLAASRRRLFETAAEVAKQLAK